MKAFDQGMFRPEVKAIFHQQAHEIHVRLDRFFAFLMIIQWVAAIFLDIHLGRENGFLGITGGGFLALPAFFCVWKFSGRQLTRIIVALSQMGFSLLFIVLTAGRTEAHYHIFISLAALAFYKDIGLLVLASAVVIIGQWLRRPGDLMWLEYLAWIGLQDTILIVGTLKIRGELWQMAYSKDLLIQAREEALNMSSKKSSFLSTMSHEIRTPLNSIVGFSDILKDTKLEEDQAEYVRTIHRCSESLLHLINDILDISKIENGLLQIDHHKFYIRELHEDIHSVFAEKCKAKGLLFTMKLDNNLGSLVRGDSHRLRQILMNLVGNAVKFTEYGEVLVEVKKDLAQGTYHWTIKDTGRGVGEENIKKLFNSYFQEDPSMSRKFGGSGLGLMITKNLVNLMEGTIQVQSIQGEGSTFSFTLPLEEIYNEASD